MGSHCQKQVIRRRFEEVEFGFEGGGVVEDEELATAVGSRGDGDEEDERCEEGKDVDVVVVVGEVGSWIQKARRET